MSYQGHKTIKITIFYGPQFDVPLIEMDNMKPMQ